MTQGAKHQVVKAAAPAGGVLGHQVASCPSSRTSSAPSGSLVGRCGRCGGLERCGVCGVASESDAGYLSIYIYRKDG